MMWEEGKTHRMFGVSSRDTIPTECSARCVWGDISHSCCWVDSVAYTTTHVARDSTTKHINWVGWPRFIRQRGLSRHLSPYELCSHVNHICIHRLKNSDWPVVGVPTCFRRNDEVSIHVKKDREPALDFLVCTVQNFRPSSTGCEIFILRKKHRLLLCTFQRALTAFQGSVKRNPDRLTSNILQILPWDHSGRKRKPIW